MSPELARGEALRETVQLCVFRVGGEEYAVDIMRVREIAPPPPVRPVPGAPPIVLGVVDLRDGVVPVVCLRRRFGLPPLESGQGRLLLVRIGRRLVGFLVDRVVEVVRVPRGDLRPAPALDDDRAGLFPAAFGPAERLRLLLDVKALLRRPPHT